MEGNNNNNSTVNNDPGHSNKKYRGKDAIPDRDATKKKLAQQGQWQTPPLPVFAARACTTAVTAPVPTAVGITASGAATATATTAAATATATTATAGTATSNTTAKIPTTPDEYARMLQEAYKRGAEAGARAQHPGTNQQRQQQQQQQQQHSTVATVTAVGMPPPTIQHVAPTAAAAATAASVQGMGVVPRTTLTQNIQYAPATVPSGGSSGGPTTVVTAQQHQHQQQQQQQQHQHQPPSSISNSKSLPDMSSYQGTLSHPDDEEDKRKKRLARNRASARLRRLKKKNLVDSYEGEVGILEAALSKLRSHRWGSVSSTTSATTSGGSSTAANVDNHEALIEALSMERGQQPLTPEKRRELIQSIVAQQREQVNNLLDVQLENWMLSALAESGGNSSSAATATATTTTMAGESIAGSNGDATNQQQQPPPNEELDQITTELQSILQLTPEQLSLISESSRGCAHEVRDLFTVDDCLRSIHDNQWLLDEGVDEVAGEFTSILNPSQLSKFLVWSDHNADQIEKLDYVNVTAGVGNGPVFEFGVDEGLEHGD